MDKPELYDELFGYNPNKYTKFDKDVFKLRPSSLESFFNVPSEWYKEHVLKQGKVFEGNTGSVLGNTLHFCYEHALKDTSLDKEDIDSALDYHFIQNPTMFDLEEVKGLYPKMLDAALTEYINPLRQKGLTLHIEEEIFIEMSPTFVNRGLLDLRYGTTVADYKNETKKPSNLDKIPFKHKIQLLDYAYMLSKKGIFVEFIEVIYIVRPTKTIGARCYSVKERITQYDWNLIQDTLELIHESVKVAKDKPEYTHLIFKSMSLKQKPKTQLRLGSQGGK